jgi:hypothetical protein
LGIYIYFTLFWESAPYIRNPKTLLKGSVKHRSMDGSSKKRVKAPTTESSALPRYFPYSMIFNPNYYPNSEDEFPIPSLDSEDTPSYNPYYCDGEGGSYSPVHNLAGMNKPLFHRDHFSQLTSLTGEPMGQRIGSSPSVDMEKHGTKKVDWRLKSFRSSSEDEGEIEKHDTKDVGRRLKRSSSKDEGEIEKHDTKDVGRRLKRSRSSSKEKGEKLSVKDF